MQAVVFERYGVPDVLQVRRRPRPEPRPVEILVRIGATTVTPSDVMLRSGKFPAVFWVPARILYGVTKPRMIIPGYEFSGEVEAVGASVRRFRPGDQVFGASMWKMSCCAEYICLPETGALAPKPSGLTQREAVALVDGPCTALHFLRKAGVRQGHHVLVYGAAGAVGSAAVQLARHLGAVVTGVCSTSKIELVRGLGAHKVIDYTTRNLSQAGSRYDVIFDAVGRAPLVQCVRALNPRGVYLSTNLGLRDQARGIWLGWATGTRIAGGLSTASADKLHSIARLVEQGVLRPVIDRVYPLADVVQAHRYVAEGRKRGSVVIDVSPAGSP